MGTKCWSALLSLACAACAADLDEFRRAEGADTASERPHDGSATSRPLPDAGAMTPVEGRRGDGGAPDDAGLDGAIDGGTNAETGSRWDALPPLGDCPLPQLMVQVNSRVDGVGQGRVLRYSLWPELERCGDLEADGALPALSKAIAWVPPRSIAIGGTSQTTWGVTLVDVETDRVTWHASATDSEPMSLFVLREPSGEARVAATYGYGWIGAPPRCRAEGLRIFDDEGGVLRSWSFGSSAGWPTDKPCLLSAHPLRPSWVFASLAGATFEVNPFTGAVDGTWTSPLGARDIRGLDSYDDGLFVRTIWLSDDGVYYLDSSDDTEGVPFGPIRCRGRGAARHPCSVDEQLYSVVADPTQAGRFFATCAGDFPYEASLVRFDAAGGACEVLLRHDEVDLDLTINQLAIAL